MIMKSNAPLCSLDNFLAMVAPDFGESCAAHGPV